MRLLASGDLRLRTQQSVPMSQAAEAHRLLEEDHVHHKLLLEVPSEPPPTTQRTTHAG
jgi:NADPH:quinone reductase-like Zn-dependent oxidoreductase